MKKGKRIYLIYLIAGAICILLISDKSDKSASLLVLRFLLAKKLNPLRLCTSAFKFQRKFDEFFYSYIVEYHGVEGGLTSSTFSPRYLEFVELTLFYDKITRKSVSLKIFR